MRDSALIDVDETPTYDGEAPRYDDEEMGTRQKPKDYDTRSPYITGYMHDRLAKELEHETPRHGQHDDGVAKMIETEKIPATENLEHLIADNGERIPASPPTHTGKLRWDQTQNVPGTSPGSPWYKDCVIQPGHFAQLNKLRHYEGACIKYVCRHTMKGLPEGKGGRADIVKAIDCLKLILELDYADTKDS